jgi:hypothetical protein
MRDLFLGDRARDSARRAKEAKEENEKAVSRKVFALCEKMREALERHACDASPAVWAVSEKLEDFILYNSSSGFASADAKEGKKNFVHRRNDFKVHPFHALVRYMLLDGTPLFLEITFFKRLALFWHAARRAKVLGHLMGMQWTRRDLEALQLVIDGAGQDLEGLEPLFDLEARQERNSMLNKLEMSRCNLLAKAGQHMFLLSEWAHELHRVWPEGFQSLGLKHLADVAHAHACGHKAFLLREAKRLDPAPSVLASDAFCPDVVRRVHAFLGEDLDPDCGDLLPRLLAPKEVERPEGASEEAIKVTATAYVEKIFGEAVPVPAV